MNDDEDVDDEDDEEEVNNNNIVNIRGIFIIKFRLLLMIHSIQT